MKQATKPRWKKWADLADLKRDECPFVTLTVPGDNGPEHTVWWQIRAPGEEAEMNERLVFDRFSLFAARIADFDFYLGALAEYAESTGDLERATTLLRLRSVYRDLWCGKQVLVTMKRRSLFVRKKQGE